MPRVRNRRRGPSVSALACALGLVGSAAIGLGLIYGDPDKAVTPPVRAVLAAQPAKIALVRHEMALFDPALTSGYAPAPFGRSAPLRTHFADADAEHVALAAAAEPDVPDQPGVADMPGVQPETLAVVPPIDTPALVPDVPLPTPRPAFANRMPQPRRLAQLETPPGPPASEIAPPSDGRTLLERMFGAPTAAPANPALAYATPGETGGFFGSSAPASASNGTAVYNIARHIVTLPDGSRLEAHSGLGLNLDNPNSVTEHMRGATPPTIYELTQRETLFHGVRALRLTPLLEGTTFGRGGLLAHTFMLGPRGDSNGCVVFRNYAAFLSAYDRGQIRRLLVVAGT